MDTGTSVLFSEISRLRAINAELLAALEVAVESEVLRARLGGYEPNKWTKQARAAIAKAKE
jgi:hypothetical protein